MCSLFKKPKVVSAPVAADAPILRNPYLDGLDSVVRARQGGVRSLTIRRATGTANNPTAPTLPTTPTPITSGGSGTGSGGSGGNLTDLTNQRNSLALVSKTLSSKV